MNNTRTFLYVVLGILFFALWSAWQKDYAPIKPVASEQKHITEPVNNNVVGRSVSSISNDLSTKTFAANLIGVVTDVFDIKIDTVSGNVVQAKLLKYPVSGDDHAPIQILNSDANKFYVASSSLLPANGGNGYYTAAAKNHVLSPDNQNLNVDLTWHGIDGVEIKKTFIFTRGKYDINVVYNIKNDTDRDFTGDFVAALHRKNLNEESSGLFRFQTFSGPSIATKDGGYDKLTYKKLDKENIDRTHTNGWVAFQQPYFLGAWIPEASLEHRYFSEVDANKIYSIGFRNTVHVKAHSDARLSSILYVGPEIAANLKSLAKGLDLTLDYGWFWFISLGLLWLLKQIHRFIGNWGWSIILVTLFVKLAFYKLSEKSYRSMAKMRDLAPRLQALKERYGSDKHKISQATMELYRKEKVNPLGGCLPILIQIPVFIALYYVLVNAVELRQAPFMFWISDLSVKDPFYVLPILMGFSMLLQQRLSPAPPDPMQAKVMMFLPVVFTVFFVNFPSGLVLYWLVNNCLSILQQWYIMKKVKA